MNIGFIGMGVVGGITAKVFSKKHKIFPYDKYKKEYNSKDKLMSLVKNSEIIFVSVPTPMKKSGSIDYSAIYDVLKTLQKEVQEQEINPSEVLIILRSTTVSGTTDKFAREFPFRFALNPEFLTERTALKDMENTDRVIIGVEDEESKDKILKAYKLIFPDAKYIIINRKEAEMIKYAANVMLASQVGIANEIYQICNHVGIDYETVRKAITTDEDDPSKLAFNLIGKNIKVPGPDGDLGFGGKCLPKDLSALIYLARENGYRPNLLEEVWSTNEKLRKNKNWLDITGTTSDNSFY